MTDAVPNRSPEWSLPVAVDRVGPGPLCVVAELPPERRAAVAARLDLPSVDRLRCEWTLRPVPGRDAVEAEGVLDATVTRECVVTLEPFESRVGERFTVRFAPADELVEDDDIGSPDELPYHGRSIELGDATVEQLALALDPFPRAPAVAAGAEAPETVTIGRDEEGGSGPFAALAARRRRTD